MRYKVLFSDIDGTIVPNDPLALPSERVANVISKAKNHLIVSLVTGRTLHQAKKVIDHLDVTGLCVVNSGTQIYDPVKKKVIKEIVLDPVIVKKVFTVFDRLGLQPSICDGIVDSPYYGEILKTIVLDIFVADIAPEKIGPVERDLRAIEDIYIHKMYSWNKGYISLDITDQTATKLHGVVDILKMTHIKREEVIGIGDGYNDFPLLEACGLKIAMGNAVSELKAIADFIAPSVEEDGIATVLEKFILSPGAP